MRQLSNRTEPPITRRHFQPKEGEAPEATSRAGAASTRRLLAILGMVFVVLNCYGSRALCTYLLPLVGFLATSSGTTPQSNLFVYDLPHELRHDYVSNNWRISYIHQQYYGNDTSRVMPHMFAEHNYRAHTQLDYRFKKSDLRTLDPSSASFFVVPWYGDCHYGSPEFVSLLRYLNQSLHFHRRQGLDHVWPQGRNLGQASYQKCPIVHPDLLLKYLPEFAPLAPLILNMIKVSSSIFTWRGNPWDRGLAKSDPNVIAVPPSSWIHYDDRHRVMHPTSLPPWCRGTKPTAPGVLVAFAGATETTQLRRTLSHMCGARQHACEMVGSSALDPASRMRSMNGVMRPIIDLYQRATFCLHPPGDDPDRKGLFDSALLGCIPVVFDAATLDVTYPWYVPCPREISVAFYDNQTVLDLKARVFMLGGDERNLCPITPNLRERVPRICHRCGFVGDDDFVGDAARRTFAVKGRILPSGYEGKVPLFTFGEDGANIVDVLSGIPASEIIVMRQNLCKIGHTLQYKMGEANFDELPDAFDSLVDKIFKNVESDAAQWAPGRMTYGEATWRKYWNLRKIGSGGVAQVLAPVAATAATAERGSQ